MKKLLFLVLFGLLISPYAKAETLYGFMNGQLFNVTGELKAFCFVDKNCYNLEGKQVWNDNGEFTTIKPAGIVESANTVSPVASTPIPQNTSVAITYQQPTQQTTVTVTPIASVELPMAELNPTESWNLLFKNIIRVTPNATSTFFGREGRWDDFGVNTKVIFNGQTVLTRSGNAITSVLEDGNSFTPNTRDWVKIDNLLPDTEYTYTIEYQGNIYKKFFSTLR